MSEPKTALDLAREWRGTADPARSPGIADRLNAIPLDAVDRLARLEKTLLDLDRLFRAEDMVGFTSLLETIARDLREKA